LESDFSPHRDFDLVECLEVAEHLEETAADRFVESLTSHTGTVLFSAAVPGQGGTHHVTEQWPSYWIPKFGRAGFQPFDVIRPRIWKDRRVVVWYRQNILIFANGRVFDPPEPCFDWVHPELWADRTNYGAHPRQLLWSLPEAVKTIVRRIRR
jgi:hypothetical protein